MKILLVRVAPSKKSIGLNSIMRCEPLELMTLASTLELNDHEVEILDMLVEKKSFKSCIKNSCYDLVGFTGYITHVNIIKDYARIVKEILNSTVCVGGVHATIKPDDFTSTYIDKVFTNTSEFYSYMDCKNFSRFPKRNLASKYLNKYYYLFQKDCALIKTSFGCPYNCSFCVCKNISSYYARDIKEVIEELRQIKQSNIYIVDDDFLYDRARLIEFVELIKKYNIKKQFLVYGRSDFIAENEDIIEALKESGLYAVIVGVESDSQTTLNDFNKSNSVNNNIKAIQVLRKYDIECFATIILMDDFDKSDFKNLRKFLIENKVYFVNLQPITPMPTTSYFNENNDYYIKYGEFEKWDMAHIVCKPTKLSVRQFYLQIIISYIAITLRFCSTKYTIKKYGILNSIKLSMGGFYVLLQYLKKVVNV